MVYEERGRVGCDATLSLAKRRPEGAVLLSATSAVILLMNVAEVTVGNMRINLCRVDRGVAEELLDGADVSTV